MLAFENADREAYFRAQSQKKSGPVLTIPMKRTCKCCGVTRNAQTQFQAGSEICRNCLRPR